MAEELKLTEILNLVHTLRDKEFSSLSSADNDLLRGIESSKIKPPIEQVWHHQLPEIISRTFRSRPGAGMEQINAFRRLLARLQPVGKSVFNVSGIGCKCTLELFLEDRQDILELQAQVLDELKASTNPDAASVAKDLSKDDAVDIMFTVDFVGKMQKKRVELVAWDEENKRFVICYVGDLSSKNILSAVYASRHHVALLLNPGEVESRAANLAAHARPDRDDIHVLSSADAASAEAKAFRQRAVVADAKLALQEAKKAAAEEETAKAKAAARVIALKQRIDEAKLKKEADDAKALEDAIKDSNIERELLAQISLGKAATPPPITPTTTSTSGRHAAAPTPTVVDAPGLNKMPDELEVAGDTSFTATPSPTPPTSTSGHASVHAAGGSSRPPIPVSASPPPPLIHIHDDDEDDDDDDMNVDLMPLSSDFTGSGTTKSKSDCCKVTRCTQLARFLCSICYTCYCSRNCQELDWLQHAKECRAKDDDQSLINYFHIGVDFYDERQFIAAFKFFNIAADRGHKESIYNLAVCYIKGHGVAVDNKKGFELLKDLGAVKMAKAHWQLMVAVCYQRGIGVDIDDAEAVKWYLLAEQQGSAAAAAYMSGIRENANKLD